MRDKHYRKTTVEEHSDGTASVVTHQDVEGILNNNGGIVRVKSPNAIMPLATPPLEPYSDWADELVAIAS